LNQEYIKAQKSIVNQLKDKVGIDYRPVSSGYTIILVLPDFIIKKGNDHFLFKKEGGLKIGVQIDVGTDYIQIKDWAKVLNMPYHHPFVFKKGNLLNLSEGTICYAEGEVQNEDKVNFNKRKLRGLNYKDLALDIALTLDHGRTNLQSGYIKGVKPVRDLDLTNFRNEYVTKPKIISKYPVFGR